MWREAGQKNQTRSEDMVAQNQMTKVVGTQGPEEAYQDRDERGGDHERGDQSLTRGRRWERKRRSKRRKRGKNGIWDRRRRKRTKMMEMKRKRRTAGRKGRRSQPGTNWP
jgi:hypothetical protein